VSTPRRFPVTVEYNPELAIRREDKHVLVDADCVAYWAAATCDDQAEGMAINRVDMRMNQILDECRASFHTSYLTGSGNFREDIATLQQYKGNRYDAEGNRTKPQPKWLQECREYLIESWDGILCDGQEADDALGIHRAKFPWDDKDYIISSIDKDLQINFGYHHNQNTGNIIRVLPGLKPLEIEEKISSTNGKVTKKIRGVGLMFFWAQMIMGDAADSIKGLPKATKEVKARWPGVRIGAFGQMGAAEILSGITTEEDAQEAVWFCYKSFWENNGYKHWKTGEVFEPGLKTAEKQFIEQGRLLWMRTKEGELWEPNYCLK